MKTHTLITAISILSLSGACLSFAGDEKEEEEGAACCQVESENHEEHTSDAACCQDVSEETKELDEDAACCEVIADEHKHHEAEMPGLGTHTSHSIFNVESTWENQNGQEAPLSQIGGRVQVIAMVYTTCKYACPRILADLKTIQAGLSDFGPKDLGFTLVTIDPKRDTVEAFNAYAKKNDLDADTWTFLRGDPGDILELAALLGVKYKKLPDGEFAHSNIITLLNPNGEIAYQLNGLGANPAELIDAAKGHLHDH